MNTIALHIIPIIFTLLALGHVRTLAGRRSAMREGLATVGAVIIIIGLCSKAALTAFVLRGDLTTTTSIGVGYGILAAGFVLLMYGFVGWDRMLLSRPGWVKPLGTVLILETSFMASTTSFPETWFYGPISVVLGCVMVMDLLLLGYTIRQRYFLATPFVILHMISVIVTTLIDIQHQSYAQVVQVFVMTATTSAILFYINMWLIKRHTSRGRMLIV